MRWSTFGWFLLLWSLCVVIKPQPTSFTFSSLNPASQTVTLTEWKSHGPENLSSFSLAMNPSDPTQIYASSYKGGVYKSTNGGGSWFSASNGMRDTIVGNLALDPAQPATVYCATTTGGLYKTTDGGSTWVSKNSGIPDLVDYALILDPLVPSTLFVGTQDHGAYKSTNGGETWTPILGQRVTAFVFDPTNPQILYAGAQVGTESCFVYRSTNSGNSWVQGGGFPSSGEKIKSFAIHPSNPSLIYASGESYGIYKSTNSGLSWTFSRNGLTSWNTAGILINPTTPTTLYTVNSQFHHGNIQTSTDGGQTWVTTNTGYPTGVSEYNQIGTLIRHPSQSNTYYLGSSLGVYYSTDSCASWSNLPTTGANNTQITGFVIDPLSSSTLYAASQTGIFKSINAGLSWEMINSGLDHQGSPPSNQKLVIDPVNPLTLYSGTSYGVFKSLDGGNTWMAAGGSNSTEFGVNDLELDPVTPQTLFSGRFNGVFKTTDGGASWFRIHSGVTQSLLGPYQKVLALSLASSAPGTIFAITEETSPGIVCGMIKSTDSGATWSILPPFQLGPFQSFEVSPQDPNLLFVTTGNGFFRSTNGGISWSQSNSGLPSTFAISLVFDPLNPNVMYLGIDGGICKSSNGGLTWTPLTTTGLVNREVTPLALSRDGAVLYGGTPGQGVCLLGLTGATVPSIQQFYPVASAPFHDITIRGNGFFNASTQVFFGGSNRVPAGNVTVLSPFLLKAEIPASSTGIGNINGYLTVRVGNEDFTTQNLAPNAADPSNPAATFPEFVLWGDADRDGVMQTRDITLARAFLLFQATPNMAQMLALNVNPLNSNGSRGDGNPLATNDFALLRAVSLGQASF